jgi:polysaccharide pyruvyl transferase WcaK-like protein
MDYCSGSPMENYSGVDSSGNIRKTHLMLDTMPDPLPALSGLPTVGLLNAYSSRNLGDAAIMTALASMVPQGSVIAGIAEAKPLPMQGVICATSLKDARRLISVGGDIFNNARPWLATRTFIGNVAALASAGPRGMVFGQTIPSSCRGAALFALSLAMRRLARVVVRDEQSWRLLKIHGVDARLSYDTAFVLSPTWDGRARARTLLDRAGIDPERAALVSVRSFDALYPHDQTDTEHKLAALIVALRARGHQPAILIQSDVDIADTDLAIASRLAAAVPGVPTIDCVNVPDDPAPVATLLGLLQISNLVVGLRYHTTVLRLAAGRQAYNLHYSRKGEDLSIRLGLPGTRVDDIDVARDIAAIEGTAHQPFDAGPISGHVRASFDDAFGALR